MSEQSAVSTQGPMEEYFPLDPVGLRMGARSASLTEDKIRYEDGRNKIEYPLSAITRIGWGVTRLTDSVTVFSVPVIEGVTVKYHLRFGDEKHLTDMSEKIKDTPESRTAFSNCTDRMWKLVGVRLLVNFLQGLQAGKHYSFGDVVVDDFGVALRRPGVFRRAERVQVTWDQVRTWQGNGSFCIGAKGEKLQAEFPYAEANNARVLEAGIKAAVKERVRRLSESAFRRDLTLYTDQRKALGARIRDLNATLSPYAVRLKAMKLQLDGLREQAKNGGAVDEQAYNRLTGEYNSLLERLQPEGSTLEQLLADYKRSFG